MNKKKTKKTKVEDIPVMTTESYVRENNHLLWEMRQLLSEFSREQRTVFREMWEMLADVYCYADDLRQYSYKFIQFPIDKKIKEKLVNHIGEFNRFNERMKLLDMMIAGDKGEYVKKEESNRKDIN